MPSLRPSPPRPLSELLRMSLPAKFSMLSLPDEIIALIIEHIDDSKTLQRLSRTCRRMQSLAENQLYRFILARSFSHVQRLNNAFFAEADRAKAVRSFNVPCQQWDPPDFFILMIILESMRNLRELMIESPECNTSHFEHPTTWQRMTSPIFCVFEQAASGAGLNSLNQLPLQRLRKLTLHLNGPLSPYWDLDIHSSHILLHPTLQELKISCVNLDIIPLSAGDSSSCTDQGAVIGKSTPLQHLILEECNISHRGLLKLMSLPKALETLYLGENCHNMTHFPETSIPDLSNHLFERDARSTIQALAQQQHSLKRFVYATSPTFPEMAELSIANYNLERAVDGGFRDFYELERIQLNGFCPAFERCVLSENPPPNLKHLGFKAKKTFRRLQNVASQPTAGTTTSSIPFLRAPHASIPKSLTNLDITYSADRGYRVVDLVNHGSRERSFIRDAVKTTSEMGIKLRVYATNIEGEKTYFPPFLHGEQEPRDDLVFADGDFVGSFRVSERRSNRIARLLMSLRARTAQWEGLS